MRYYRQSKNFERKGIDLSRATIDKWQLEFYKKLKPLEKIMLEHINTGKVLNMDETTTQILHYENGNSERKKSYIWLAHGGLKDKPLAIYRYFESRSPQYIRPFINGFKEIYFEENRLREKQLPDSEFIQKRKNPSSRLGNSI